jgi:hypothetical protein
MTWKMSHRADPFARDIADRHYNRQKIGSPQFAPPGRCLVLTAQMGQLKALWITSWPYAQYVKHEWAGAWVCSAFRTEGIAPASALILLAVSATKSYYGKPPTLGMVTFVDPRKVRPTMVRGTPVWGWTYRKAGFEECGKTKGGLIALQLSPNKMPPAWKPEGFCSPHRDFRPE